MIYIDRFIIHLGISFIFLFCGFVQAKQKLSSSGVVLGDDVLTLEVVPHMDHSLIMAIVIVYGLIYRKM